MEKMIYEKPVLEVEIFQLDAEIAGSCVQGAGHSDFTCLKGQGETPLFSTDMNCDVDANDPSTCYHIAAQAVGLFAS
ncbi:MAG: hypothetical protein ACI4WV_06685 [Eubacteriales bacterium]